MSENSCVFYASGEACATCVALDGAVVPEGFTPHAHCGCQSVPDDGGCTWSFRWVENDRYGDGPWDIRAGIEVTVMCPDGNEISMSTMVESGGCTSLDDWEEVLTDAAEEAASELCSQCAASEGEPIS